MTEPAANPLDSWRPFRGPFARWPRTADTLLALFALLPTLAAWSSNSAADEAADSTKFLAFLLFLFASLSLIWRRRQPLRVHIIVMAASFVSLSDQLLSGPIFALVISLYSLGRYEADKRRSVLGVLAALVLIAFYRLLLGPPDGNDPITLLAGFLVWYVGRRIRFRGEYLRLLKERAEQLEREQHAEAEKAVTEERTRIARELHDIVAHQVSLMTVQAGAAKVVAGKNPGAARDAMASVETAGRQALDELRHLMGVLRPGARGDERLPQPGLQYLTRLIEDFRKTGLSVAVAIDPDLPPLPARVDLSLYRIVQEALTNVLKHAGPGANTSVTLSSSAEQLEVVIENDQAGAASLPGTGYGIAGMRERAEVLGGTVDAGPAGPGRFCVRATLPTGDTTQ